MAVRPILLDFEYNLFNFFDERSEDEPRLLGRAKRQADYSARVSRDAAQSARLAIGLYTIALPPGSVQDYEVSLAFSHVIINSVLK